jgi:hypothetical protein
MGTSCADCVQTSSSVVEFAAHRRFIEVQKKPKLRRMREPLSKKQNRIRRRVDGVDESPTFGLNLLHEIDQPPSRFRGSSSPGDCASSDVGL